MQSRPSRPLSPLKVGTIVYYRGKLCRVQSVEDDESYGFCWLIDNDGDTYLVPRRHSDLHDPFLRVLAEFDRDEFDF